MNPAPFDDHTFSAPDGLRLHARIYTPAKESHGDVICLPGLTRNGRDFHDLALYLSQNADRPKRVIAIDMRGRGGSGYDADFSHYNIVTEAEDVLAGMAALDIHHADFIGTSRGGLIIHILAAMRPAVLKSIVLNDIGPVVEPVGLMQIKAYLTRAPKPKDWADAVNIQKTLHGHEFPSLKHRDWEIHARAIYREKDDKRITADFDPKLVKTLKDLDPAEPLPALWAQFAGLRNNRLMVIRGENSKLLSEATLREMKAAHPKMASVEVPGQGHAPMLWTAGLPDMIGEFFG
jgi:pimeloyl-ACP methyl ester carboxylesterase